MPAPEHARPLLEPRPDGDWGKFLDSAIHDLNTPMRGIGTSASLLSEMCAGALDAEAEQQIARILDGVRRMDGLLKALTEYSMALQGDALPRGPVATEGVVRSALQTLEPAVRETGALIHYTSLPCVTGSWEQLSTLFRNLLANALQYTGGESPRVTISAEPSHDKWLFSVHDNGVGIEPQYSERIFLPFQRFHSGHHSGPGLGLAVCRNIVESHGGMIWVESTAGAGSTFFFTLPDGAEN